MSVHIVALFCLLQVIYAPIQPNVLSRASGLGVTGGSRDTLIASK